MLKFISNVQIYKLHYLKINYNGISNSVYWLIKTEQLTTKQIILWVY